MLSQRFLGTIRKLDRAPAGWYVERKHGFDGPYRSADEAQQHLPKRTIGPDGRLPDLTDAVIYWRGPGG